MDNLGAFNFFTSHFVIGCEETDLRFTQTITNEIDALHKWMNFKDNNWGMNKYRTERTQYISYLRIIDFDDFKIIVQDLYKAYVLRYEFSEVEDFIDDVFSYTLFDLQRIIEMDLTWIGCPRDESNYVYYYYFKNKVNEFIDFGIDSTKDINYFKQYYKKVINYITAKKFIKSEKKIMIDKIEDVKNADELLLFLSKNNFSLGFLIKIFQDNFKNNNVLLGELLEKINSIYLDVFKKFNENDLKLLLDSYNEDEPPFMFFDETDLLKTKHFQRNINDEIYISSINLKGFNNCENGTKVYLFSYMIREKYNNIKFFSDFSFLNSIKNFELILDIEKVIKNSFIETESPPKQSEPNKGTKTDLFEKATKLKEIWLPEAKITVENFISKGIDIGLWNNNLQITTQRGSLYGTGKTLLGNIFIAIKGWAISNHYDYIKAGEVFCDVFNIKINKTTKEPFKSFSSGNVSQIKEIKRTFRIT